MKRTIFILIFVASFSTLYSQINFTNRIEAPIQRISFLSDNVFVFPNECIISINNTTAKKKYSLKKYDTDLNLITQKKRLILMATYFGIKFLLLTTGKNQ